MCACLCLQGGVPDKCVTASQYIRTQCQFVLVTLPRDFQEWEHKFKNRMGIRIKLGWETKSIIYQTLYLENINMENGMKSYEAKHTSTYKIRSYHESSQRISVPIIGP